MNLCILFHNHDNTYPVASIAKQVNIKSGWQDSNLRELAPKARGQPLPHILKMESAGFEPAISGLQDQRLPSLATAP